MLFEHCDNVFWSESSVLSRSMSFFSSLSKIIQGDTRVRTRDLSDCSRMLYHWAISPLHAYSIPSPQTRAGCLSTVTMFFVPSQVYSRDWCHFSLVFQKLYKGTPFVRTRDLSDYSRMLYPELYPRCIKIRKYYCKHAQVVWALLQCFSVPVKCTLAIDVIFASFKNYTRGHPGSNQGPLGLQANALPLSYLPAAYRFNNITANTCRLFEHCDNVFWSESSVRSRSMSFFSSLSKIIQGDTLCSNQGSFGLPPNALPRAISPLHTDSKISLQTRSGCLSTVTMFFVPSKVFSRDRCHFSLVSKIIQGDTRVRTRNLSDCSRMLYHWAISPLHIDSITSLQTRACCLSTVTMFSDPSQVYSRDRCHFSLVFQKLYKGTPGFEPGTSRTAVECSTTELYPRCMHIQ